MIKYCELVAVNFRKYDNTDMLIKIATYCRDMSDFINMEKYYKLAAENESPIALTQLAADKGDVNEIKKVVEHYKAAKNDDNVEYYYNLLYKKGDESAITELIDYYTKRMETCKAMPYHKILADNGNIDNMIKLYQNYRLHRDFTNMVHYYKLAAAKSNIEAINYLIYFIIYAAQKGYIETMPKIINIQDDTSNDLVCAKNCEEKKMYKNMINSYNKAITEGNGGIDLIKNIITNFEMAVDKSIIAIMPKFINVINYKFYLNKYNKINEWFNPSMYLKWSFGNFI